jgi:hypothetical protein
MKIQNAADTVVASLICGITNENFNNCDYCPMRIKCDECAFETRNNNPLSKEKVRSAVTQLWDEKTYEILEPILVIGGNE